MQNILQLRTKITYNHNVTLERSPNASKSNIILTSLKHVIVAKYRNWNNS